MEARQLHPARVSLLEPEAHSIEPSARLERLYRQALPGWPLLEEFPDCGRTICCQLLTRGAPSP